MKVYIAAPYPLRDAALAVMHACEAVGITVTSRWLTAPCADDDAHARQDLADVRAADLLLALNPPDWAEQGTGGRHVELGYALALAIPVLLVGPRSNIFHHLTQVAQTDATTPEAIAQVVGARRDGAASADDAGVTSGASESTLFVRMFRALQRVVACSTYQDDVGPARCVFCVEPNGQPHEADCPLPAVVAAIAQAEGC